MANLNTPAYKRSEAAFGDMLYHELHQRRLAVSSEQDLPVGQGVQPLARALFTGQGALVFEERPLDLAIEGEGYFRLVTDGGEELYSRNGSLQLDAEGRLVNANGDYLDVPFTLGLGVADLTISPEGAVMLKGEDGEGVGLGQIHLYRFANPGGLVEIGGGRYRATEVAGEPREGIPGEEGFGRIRQYYLEQSNANIGTEMINLLTAQRALQANIRGLLTADELQALTLQIRV